MRLQDSLNETIEGVAPQSFEALAENLPNKTIEAALKNAGHEAGRRRDLPPTVVVWLLIGMALFRERCIVAVAGHLRLARGANGQDGPSGSALVQARDRLGAQPVEAVFAYTAEEWALCSAERDQWRGLRLLGVDGSTLRVPDTVENDAEFGRPTSAKHRGQSGYPQVRLAGLMALRSHLLLGVSFGPYRTGECTLAKKLWHLLPDHSLTMVDRGFIDFALFHAITTSGRERHFLTRAKKGMKWHVIKPLGCGDDLVVFSTSSAARKKNPDLPKTMMLRAIRYQRKGFQPQTLLTSMLDAEAYPAAEVRPLYHDRWELELGYDELKTHTLEREECLRTKTPERIRQELWGLVLAYNLVRCQMECFADKNHLPPRRISYRNSLLLVRNTCICAASGVGSARKLLDSMNAEMRLIVLPERRERRFPRAVKIKMSNYMRNTGRPKASAERLP